MMKFRQCLFKWEEQHFIKVNNNLYCQSVMINELKDIIKYHQFVNTQKR